MILSPGSHSDEYVAKAPPLKKNGVKYVDDTMPLEKNAGLIMAVRVPCRSPA
jgi:hypothetical protein